MCGGVLRFRMVYPMRFYAGKRTTEIRIPVTAAFDLSRMTTAKELSRTTGSCFGVRDGMRMSKRGIWKDRISASVLVM